MSRTRGKRQERRPGLRPPSNLRLELTTGGLALPVESDYARMRNVAELLVPAIRWDTTTGFARWSWGSEDSCFTAVRRPKSGR